MGRLSELTIQPQTKARYDKAKQHFYAFLERKNLELPRKMSLLDAMLCEYLEYLWATGEGRALASDTLASLQNTSPKIKGSIPAAWRLLKTWHVNELPNRAPPFPEIALQTLVGYFLFHRQPAMALSLLLAFSGMLRTGEVLAIRNKDVLVDRKTHTAVISLGLTKGGKRAGAAESVTVSLYDISRRLLQWKKATPPGSLLVSSVSAWRTSLML